jgi:hypothetical protein
MTKRETADGDPREFWNATWGEHAETRAVPDELLVTETAGLTPARAATRSGWQSGDGR